MQDIIYATKANDINVTINSLCLYVPSVIPSPQQQVLLIESIKSNFTLSFDSWTTGRKIVNTALDQQVDISGASFFNSPKIVLTARQTAERSTAANKLSNIAIFDNPYVINYFVEKDGVKYPRDGINIDHT